MTRMLDSEPQKDFTGEQLAEERCTVEIVSTWLSCSRVTNRSITLVQNSWELVTHVTNQWAFNLRAYLHSNPELLELRSSI